MLGISGIGPKAMEDITMPYPAWHSRRTVPWRLLQATAAKRLPIDRLKPLVKALNGNRTDIVQMTADRGPKKCNSWRQSVAEVLKWSSCLKTRLKPGGATLETCTAEADEVRNQVSPATLMKCSPSSR